MANDTAIHHYTTHELHMNITDAFRQACYELFNVSYEHAQHAILAGTMPQADREALNARARELMRQDDEPKQDTVDIISQALGYGSDIVRAALDAVARNEATRAQLKVAKAYAYQHLKMM